MRTATLSSSSTHLQNRINYGKLTILQLAERIVGHSDKRALKELHDKRVL